MNILKGIIIGIAKIIPGLSGTVLMISFNLYDRAIEAITSFFDNPKNNFIFLFKLFIGVVIGVVFFSKLVSYFISNYYLYTISLFIGLILGGISVIKKEIKNKKSSYALMFISFLIMLWFSFVNFANVYVIKNSIVDILVFLLAGFLEAIGTILPGISSTALLMIIGVYPYYIKILSNLLNINYIIDSLYFLIPFGIGLVGGVIVISLLVNYLFKYHKENTFAIIFGLSISTIITLITGIIPYISNIASLIIILLLMGIGYVITNIFN